MVVELGDWDLGEGVSEMRAQRRKKHLGAKMLSVNLKMKCLGAAGVIVS